MVSTITLFQYLAQCVVGASLNDVGEEEEEEVEAVETKENVQKAGVFKVIGTVKDSSKPKPDFVTEVLKVCFECWLNLSQLNITLTDHVKFQARFLPFLFYFSVVVILINSLNNLSRVLLFG